MYKVQVLNSIATVGLNQFPNDLYDVGTDISTPDALLVRSYDMHKMTIPSSVIVVGRAGTGVNNIPVKALTERGIPVLNTPGANANAVRELVIAGMLLASRHICEAWNYVTSLNHDLENQIEKNKKQFVGFELLGKTLGVIGLGSVGVKVANAALHLGMKVIGYDPSITVNHAWELSSEVKQAANLEELLTHADFVTLHVPLIEATKNMINSRSLSFMKKHPVLLNFSREGIVDSSALMQALKEKKIKTYVTDFPHSDLMGMPDVICLPHLGASTQEAEENCAVMIVKQIRDFFEKGSISHSVNFPSVDMPKNPECTRLAIVNLNIPTMLAQISTKIASAKLNIVSFMNQSKEDIAYTLIDVDGPANPSVLKEIAGIDGVVQVRNLDY